MPFKGSKRHHANHHHGNRQNGLAQPGKKIEKLARQRSNGQLNVSTTTAFDQSHSSSSASQRMPTRHGSLTGSEDAFTEVAQSREDVVAAADDDSDEHEDLDDLQGEIQLQSNSHSAGLDGQLPRKIDVNTAGNPAVHADRGPLFFAITILRACPLADTLAILIILLQIPAAVLTIVNLLYVALTFVPPTTSNIPSLPSFADVYQGSGGAPSFLTVALADVVFFVGWMFLWTPLQDLVLDLAQVVIALSLGGRLANRHRGFKSALMCLGIVILSHLGRSRCLRMPRSSTFFLVRPPPSVKFIPWWLALRYPAFHPNKGWLHTSLAVHLLAQATVRVVRQWLSRHGKSSFRNTHTKRPSDASTPSGTHVETPANRTLTLETIDFRGIQSQPAPPPNPRPRRDRELFARKLKRQGMYVRIFQPLWAALASTKTIVLSQYAYSRIGKETTGAAARDASNLGNASFQMEEGRVWATRITTTEIFLETSFFNTAGHDITEPDSKDVSDANDAAAIARSKPFYVLVNRALWPSIRISEIKKEQSGNDEKTGYWAIEIYGLSPGTNYTCIVIRSQNNEILSLMHLTTQQIMAADHAGRASLPLTALKKDIAAAEAKLEEEKANIKKIRKEHKVQTTSLKKEVDASKTRFVNSGSNDDRQRQRLLQIGQHIRQAEDAAAQVSSQTEAMGQVPEHDLSDCRESRETWETIRRRHSEAQAELNESARKSDRQIAAIQSEAANLQQKRERVQVRQNKLKDQYERLGNANVQGLSGRDRAATAHAGKDGQRQSAEQRFIEQSQTMHDSLKEIQLGSQQLWQQVRVIETAYLDQQQRASSAPTTPEGNLPGTMMGNRNPPAARFGGNFVFPPGLSTQPTVSSRSTPGHREGRARSSSLLSNVSGLTDFVDFPDTAMNGMSYTSRENPRNDGGFGSGRSRSGSHRDPSSPFPKQYSPYAAGGKGTSTVWR